MNIPKEEILIVEGQIYSWCDPYRVFIYDTNRLNSEADRIQTAKGELPLFDYNAPDYNSEDWYDFWFMCDEDDVYGLCFGYGNAVEVEGEIEIDEQTKKDAYDLIMEYFGGRDKYIEYANEMNVS